MNIEKQFNQVAQEYDGNRRKFIPCFDDFYQGTTRFIAANIATPKRILDLGAGTGLLSAFWFPHAPQSEYVLVDIAREMLKVARQRFAGQENVLCQTMDYCRELPQGPFDVIVSALSIHHLRMRRRENCSQGFMRPFPLGACLSITISSAQDSRK